MTYTAQKPSATRAWASIAEQWVKRGHKGFIVSARDALKDGDKLIELKSVTPDGELKQKITALGLSPNTAARYMDAAYRFKQAPDAFLNAVGSASKLFELLPVAEQLAFTEKVMTAVNSNGQSTELPFEKLAHMTTKDVRKLVRELREPLVAGPKQDDAAPVTSDALSEEEMVLLRRYRQCPQVAQSCLQLMAGLLLVNPS